MASNSPLPPANILSFPTKPPRSQKAPPPPRPFFGPIVEALSTTPWAAQLGLNLLSQKVCYRPHPGAPWEEFTPHHRMALEQFITGQLEINTANSSLLQRIIHHFALQNPFDPLLDYLNGLRWDGTHRIHLWAERYLGVAPSPQPTDLPWRYTQLMPMKWLVSAVVRAFEPGSKVDNTLVLEGKQGRGKSTALSILGGPFYLGHLPQITRTRDAAEVIRGHWLIEIDELDGFDRAKATKINSFLTQISDTYRKAWAPDPESFPRRCVFAATTNESDWLTDHTGGRRFWPIQCQHIDADALRRDRDQLWAEAVAAYRIGFPYWIASPAEASLAQQVVADRLHQDAWTTDIQAHLSYHSLPLVAVSSLMKALNIEVERRNPHDAARIAKILTALQWTPIRANVLSFDGSKKQRLRLWLRPNTPPPPDLNAVPPSQVML